MNFINAKYWMYDWVEKRHSTLKVSVRLDIKVVSVQSVKMIGQELVNIGAQNDWMTSFHTTF